MRRIINKLSNRIHYTLLAMVLVVLLGIGIYALAPSIDTSQGYHESEQISVSVSGVEKTLQEAIDDKSLGGSIPSGAVLAFNLAGCPDGWSEYTSAQDRTIIGSGSSYSFGDVGGASTHTLTIAEMPAHTHTDSFLSGIGGEGGTPHSLTRTAGASWYATNSDSNGGNQPHNNMQPYIALLYCVKN